MVGVVRYGGDILVCVAELGGREGAGGEEGAGDCAEGGEEEEDGGVGDGFGAGGGGVAVYDAWDALTLGKVDRCRGFMCRRGW